MGETYNVVRYKKDRNGRRLPTKRIGDKLGKEQ